MAKKKHKKKHSFQHKNAPATVVSPVVAANGERLKKPNAKINTMPNEWTEVSADVRKTLILAVVFIGIMIGLWYLLDVSSFGSSVYDSIKL